MAGRRAGAPKNPGAMCTIDKMLIKGIRSFSPDNNAVICFFRPLTLIVGPNGAGKTVRTFSPHSDQGTRRRGFTPLPSGSRAFLISLVFCDTGIQWSGLSSLSSQWHLAFVRLVQRLLSTE